MAGEQLVLAISLPFCPAQICKGTSPALFLPVHLPLPIISLTKVCKEVIFVTKLAFKSHRLNKQTCDQLTGRVRRPPAGASDGLRIGAT